MAAILIPHQARLRRVPVKDKSIRLFSNSSYLHSGRRPAVQNVSVIAQGHGGGHASPIEAAGQ